MIFRDWGFMSNKSKTDKAIAQGLVPKLRFPEFRDAGEWEEKPLDEVAKRITRKNKNIAVTRVLTNSAKDGIVDQRDYFDKDIANKSNLAGYCIIEEGDYVYNPRISTSAPVGPISKNKIGTGIMSPLYSIFHFKNNKNDFYEQYFKTTCWHHYIRKVGSSGARHDRMSLSTTDFMSMPVLAPCPGEQQKIADCLCSIDELITSQSQKLDTLKAHKKGLMQQLFPAEGETVPKLRFPEFRDMGAWIHKQLCEVADVNASGDLDSGNFSPTKTDEHIFPIYSNSVTQEGLYGYCTYPKYQKDSVTITARGTLGVAFYRDHDYVGIGRLLVLSNLKDVVPHFLQEIWNYSARVPLENGGIPQLTAIKARVIELYMPKKEEQKKIADCLSSVDELIAAQSQKLDTLKAHKKGLMQQLFPSVGEVDG